MLQPAVGGEQGHVVGVGKPETREERTVLGVFVVGVLLEMGVLLGSCILQSACL